MNGLTYKKLIDDRNKPFSKQHITKNKVDQFTIITHQLDKDIKSQDELRIKDDFNYKLDEYKKKLEEIKKIII